MKIDIHSLQHKDTPISADFSDIKIVHKFADNDSVVHGVSDFAFFDAIISETVHNTIKITVVMYCFCLLLVGCVAQR